MLHQILPQVSGILHPTQTRQTGSSDGEIIYYNLLKHNHIMRLNAIVAKLNARHHWPAVFPQAIGRKWNGGKSHGDLLVAKRFLQHCLPACSVTNPSTSPRGKYCSSPPTVSVTGAWWWTVTGLPWLPPPDRCGTHHYCSGSCGRIRNGRPLGGAFIKISILSLEQN